MIVFGPIPSRRLGRSLGVNNIPPKQCTYSCVYCQVGLTNHLTTTIRDFFSTDEIFKEVKNKVEELHFSGEKVDYISIVPDGEPTLDINLGITIEKLRTLGIKIAVITNSSLLSDEEVRSQLKYADWVSLKIDSAIPRIWEKIDRPHGFLKLPEVVKGIIEFALEFEGDLVTETMLVKDLNDSDESLEKTAGIIRKINPLKAYILIPTRPPVESWVKAPDAYRLNKAYQIFSSLGINTELLIGDSGTEFTFISDAEKELLSILSVHPMRKDAVEKFILKSGTRWSLIEKLIDNNKIKEVTYNKDSYFILQFN